MNRVVVTGMGLVCPLGNELAQVTESLRAGRSGIRRVPEYAELGLRSEVAGIPEVDISSKIERKTLRFMSEAAAYAFLAMHDAVDDAGLTQSEISDPRVGLIAGSGGGSLADTVELADILRAKGSSRAIGPYRVSRTMSSTVSANLACAYAIQGVNFSIASACATSAHCIGTAMQLIQSGVQDRIFAGGGEAVHWSMSVQFDAMGALSASYNATPEQASRPFDAGRDGFVIGGGGGMMVLESLEAARRRGAHIHAEVVGYGATSDGAGMVAPTGQGARRCMREALATVDGPVDYLNAHATATPLGDRVELEAIREVFGETIPKITSTKSQTGHALGAAGIHEAIFSLLMMKGGFIAPSINIETLSPEAREMPIQRTPTTANLNQVMSNSFGFGGTNASLVFRRWA